MKYFKFFFGFFLLSGLMATAQTSLVGTVEIRGNSAIKSSDLKKAAGLKAGVPVDEGALARAVERLNRFFYQNGYLEARVDSVRRMADNNSAARQRVVFYIRSGHQARVDRLGIKSVHIDSLTYARILKTRPGRVFYPRLLEEDLNRMLQLAAERGYPFAQARLDSLQYLPAAEGGTVNITLLVDEGKRASVSDILIRGNSYTKDIVILRELNIPGGSTYSSKALSEVPQRLNRLQIFKDVKYPRLLQTSPDSVIVLIEVEEGNATSFDGVVGYIPQNDPNSSERGYFTGLIDITFNNLFGTGRKFAIHWKKPDQQSEEFFTRYTEPWVLGYPVDLTAGVERTVRDTTYLEWNYNINGRIHVLKNLTLVARLQRQSTIPDSLSSRRLRLLRNYVINAGIGVEYDTRDYIINPRRGIFYSSSYSFGFKKNTGPAYLIVADSLKKTESLYRLKMTFEWYRELWANQVLSLQFNAWRLKADRVQLTDMFWFGGSRSLRGYREYQFRGDIVAWTNLEYRFLPDRNSRLFLFSDWGYYNMPRAQGSKQEILAGYGLGIRFQTPLGILGIDYGLGKGDSFSSGKIHFGLVNRF